MTIGLRKIVYGALTLVALASLVALGLRTTNSSRNTAIKGGDPYKYSYALFDRLEQITNRLSQYTHQNIATTNPVLNSATSSLVRGIDYLDDSVDAHFYDISQARALAKYTHLNLVTNNNLSEILRQPRVIVLFRTTPLNPVRNLDQIAEDVASQRQEICFAKVVECENQKLTADYNVEDFPAAIYFENGKEIERSDGFEDVENMIRRYSKD